MNTQNPPARPPPPRPLDPPPPLNSPTQNNITSNIPTLSGYKYSGVDTLGLGTTSWGSGTPGWRNLETLSETHWGWALQKHSGLGTPGTVWVGHSRDERGGEELSLKSDNPTPRVVKKPKRQRPSSPDYPYKEEYAVVFFAALLKQIVV